MTSHHRLRGGERCGKGKRYDDLPSNDERGPSSIRRTLEVF